MNEIEQKTFIQDNHGIQMIHHQVKTMKLPYGVNPLDIAFKVWRDMPDEDKNFWNEIESMFKPLSHYVKGESNVS